MFVASTLNLKKINVATKKKTKMESESEHKMRNSRRIYIYII